MEDLLSLANNKANAEKMKTEATKSKIKAYEVEWMATLAFKNANSNIDEKKAKKLALHAKVLHYLADIALAKAKETLANVDAKTEEAKNIADILDKQTVISSEENDKFFWKVNARKIWKARKTELIENIKAWNVSNDPLTKNDKVWLAEIKKLIYINEKEKEARKNKAKEAWIKAKEAWINEVKEAWKAETEEDW
jgi:hypothetical protein